MKNSYKLNNSHHNIYSIYYQEQNNFLSKFSIKFNHYNIYNLYNFLDIYSKLIFQIDGFYINNLNLS